MSWTAFTDAAPPDHAGKLLVTNNITARDAFGHSSHVWLVDGVHHGEPVLSIWDENHKLSEQWFAYDPTNFGKILNLTHWRLALPEEGDATHVPT